MPIFDNGESGSSVRAKINNAIRYVEETAMIATIAAMEAKDDATDGTIYTVAAGFNGETETFKYDASSTLAADGSLVITATGMGAGRYVSTRTVYADWLEMDGDVREMATGTALFIENVGWYDIVSSGEDFTTTGGLNVNIRELPWGGVAVQQFGPTGTSDDDVVFGRFIDYLNANATTGYLGQGKVRFSTTKTLTRGGTSIVGSNGGGQRTGSTRLQSTLEWVGGAAPMFDTATSAHSFSGFGVETNGLATDFLEMNSGSQRIFMTDMYFGYGLFTRSVIRSNGNRIGYSKFHRVSATKSAPRFIDLDGQGSANGCTPVMFTECQFANAGAGGDDPWTVLYIKDEKIEHVAFERCLFIGRDGTIAVDSTDTPLSITVDVLNINNCEFDNLEGAASVFFKLENVKNVEMNGNVWTGDGTPSYMATLVNSNVTSFRGNYWKSVGYVFDLDNDCIISGVGHNHPDWSATQGIHDNPNATFLSLAQSAAVVIDGTNFAPNEIGQVVVDITSGSGFDFRMDTSKPQNIEPGQRFDITVRNVSGGLISAGAFNAATFKAAAPVAPADGFSRTYSFRFDGTHAVEIGRVASDIPN